MNYHTQKSIPVELSTPKGKLNNKAFGKQCRIKFPLPRHREGSLKQETKSIYYQKTHKYNDTKIQLLFTKRHPQENKKAGYIKPIKGSYSK